MAQDSVLYGTFPSRVSGAPRNSSSDSETTLLVPQTSPDLAFAGESPPPRFHLADAHPDDPHANDPFVPPRVRPAADQGIGDADGTPQLTSTVSEPGLGRRTEYGEMEAIDWAHDTLRESLRRRQVLRLKGWRGSVQRAWYAVQAWVLVTLIGVLAAIFAAFIVVTSEWLSDLKEGYCVGGIWNNLASCCPQGQDPTQCTWVRWGALYSHPTETSEFWTGFAAYATVGCVLCGLAATMVKYIAPFAAGSGIPEVKTILGGFVMNRFLSMPTLLVKTAGLALATASGVNLGKEGPLVHVSCAIGNIVTKFFPKYDLNEAKRREILSAASAAGYVVDRFVAFGAPIGGVLFALEEVSTYFGPGALFRSFFCALVGAFTLRVINPYGTGKIVLYEVDFTIGWRLHDVPFFILLGALGGLVGAFVIHANMRVARIRKFLGAQRWPIRDAVTVTLVTALVSYAMLPTRANLGRLVGNLVRECSEVDEEFEGLLCGEGPISSTVAILLVSFCVKIFLLTFTIGIKVPAGIFLPPLAIGALAGRALGMVVQALHESDPTNLFFARCSRAKDPSQCISPGLYALVGAAAALGGVTRMTVSLTVIIFELTGVLDYTSIHLTSQPPVLPLMFAIMTSKWVGDAFGTESIYEGLITVNKLPYLSTRIDYVHPFHAMDICHGVSSITSIPATGATLDDLRQILHTHNHHQYPVTDQNGYLLGVVSARDLWCAIEEAWDHGHHGGTVCSFLERPPPGVGDLAHLDEPQGAGPTSFNLRSWIDTTPFCVQSGLSVQVIIEYVAKLGLRYVVVVDMGVLKGMITKKDLLRHVEECEGDSPHEPRMLESEFERKMASL
ncbi:hypothetical protein M427DRAFT_104422 [Gonapodya prolifera JEL478]|uniref:Chloride channel protein n=1 Tax=Gonapodya prolifera (strain JEL478) TaxID=1344416 RepID=A0A138ZZU4_GONPJ|nr:hypothetical protein M427DRAFT_104422 [Gonapodya prolifera JEL478]|eukprot:KXS10036.1 hypothetical protein M427DRAFT_104422 [Gonapodya prolifera JEL478]